MRCVIYLRVSTHEQAEKGEGEEGFSIPAQREACTRHVRDAGWLLADEYVDRGESARSADRPALKAMLARIAEDRGRRCRGSPQDRPAGPQHEDDVAIRGLFRRRGVALVSVTENVEETASGRLVEGIHALMAEFYSANLANEIKKGLNQGSGWAPSPTATSTSARSWAGVGSPGSSPTPNGHRSSPAPSSAPSPATGPCNA